MDTDIAPFEPGDLVTDDTLLDFATFLAQTTGFAKQSLTIAWLDDGDRTLGLVVPIEDIPDVPDPGMCASLGTVLASVIDEHAPGGSVVAVVVRSGSPLLGPVDRAWNDLLRNQDGARLRGFFVATRDSVRPMTLDDAA